MGKSGPSTFALALVVANAALREEMERAFPATAVVMVGPDIWDGAGCSGPVVHKEAVTIRAVQSAVCILPLAAKGSEFGGVDRGDHRAWRIAA